MWRAFIFAPSKLGAARFLRDDNHDRIEDSDELRRVTGAGRAGRVVLRAPFADANAAALRALREADLSEMHQHGAGRRALPRLFIQQGSHIYQVGPAQFALAFGAAIIMGAVGAFGVGMLGSWALFALFYAPALGPILGKFVTRITKGKRGPLLAAATGAVSRLARWDWAP